MTARQFSFALVSLTAAAVLTAAAQQPARGRGAAAPAAPASTATAGPVALVGGMLIDGVSPAPLRNAVVLLRDGRIERVGTVADTPIPAGYQRISTEGQTMLPGLWDMHVHLLYAGHTNLQYWHRTYTPRFEREIMPATARQMLLAGVTSVRDMGAPPEAIFGVKARIAAGELEGPTIYAAGPQLTNAPPDWAQFYRWGISGPADATAKTTRLLEGGADLIKVTDAVSMTVDEIRAITAAAHARGRIVSAHGRTDVEIGVGLDGDVDDFQHIGAGANGTEFPAELMARITARARSGRPLYWTPTIGVPLNAERLAANLEPLDDPRNTAGLPALIADDVREAIRMFRPQPAARDLTIRKVRQLRDAGVQLLMGTDAGLAGAFHAQATWQEMEAWVNLLGISPMETIQRATSGAARALGVDARVGSIEAGKVADVIVVDGDPLSHIDVLREPSIVLKAGRRIK
jgi:imidazolonepropionase-like amidohydrolase